MILIPNSQIQLTNNLDNASVLTPKENFHVVDEVTTHTKELATNEKRKRWKKILKSHENAMFLHIERIVFLRAKFPTSFTTSFSKNNH